MEKLSLILQNASLKSTPQRLAILNTIQKHGHICIDDIYNEIKKTFPSISLATVYKNIHTLKDEGILTEIHPQNIKSKYEIKKSPHGHFVCKNCGMIVDFELQNVCNPKIDEIDKIEDSEVYLYGICRKCKT
jgi:Fe2+ or Zn2+ uptake regulation protein